LTIEQAAEAAGVSPSGARGWIAESGGMIPDDLDRRPSGRFLSVTEREEIAIGWAGGESKATFARRIERHRSTVGPELALNQTVRRPPPAPRPDGQPHRRGPRPGTNRGRDRPQHERLRYRAVHAQAKAEARARRPKPCKLAENPPLCAEGQSGTGGPVEPRADQPRVRRS
jgi:hypothetical protein